MDNYSVITLLSLIEKIYTQGELNPFIDIASIPNRIMLYLMSHEKAKPSEISESINVARPTVTSHLKILEDNNLITREINPTNRREIYVDMTENGKNIFNSKIQILCELFYEWLNFLGEEKEHLFKILEISSDLKNIGEKFKNYSSMIKMNSLEEEEN